LRRQGASSDHGAGVEVIAEKEMLDSLTSSTCYLIMSEASGGIEFHGGMTNQLATLVPSFDPEKMTFRCTRVQQVLSVWPQNRISGLVTGLILHTIGSAFAK